MVCSYCKTAGHNIIKCGALDRFCHNIIAGKDGAIQLVENITIVEAKYLLTKLQTSHRNIERIIRVPRERMIEVLFQVVVYKSFDERDLVETNQNNGNADYSLSEDKRQRILESLECMDNKGVSNIQQLTKDVPDYIKIYITKEPLPKDDCPICLREQTDVCHTNCKHPICLKCCNSTLKKFKTCPCCRRIVDSIYMGATK